MTNGETAAAGRGRDGAATAEPIARASLRGAQIRVEGDVSVADRVAIETLTDPAFWLAGGARALRGGGVLFGCWSFEPRARGREGVALLIRLDSRRKLDPQGREEMTARTAALAFDLDAFRRFAPEILARGRAWFEAFDVDERVPTQLQRWFQAAPPEPPAVDADAVERASVGLLPDLADELDAPRSGEADQARAARPAGSVSAAAGGVDAFWASVARFAAALPPAMRPFLSAASGFEAPPRGVLILDGAAAADAGVLEGGASAFAPLAEAPPIAFPGEPERSGAALRRGLRDVEKPAPARNLAAHLAADDAAPPAPQEGLPGRVALLRRAVAVAEEGASALQPPLAALDPVSAVRIMALIASEAGPDAEPVWAAMKRTEPARFFWSALTLRNAPVIDGPIEDVARGPIRGLADVAKLCALDATAREALPEDAPTPLDGPAFEFRLRRLSDLWPPMVVDDPGALLDAGGGPAAWIARLRPLLASHLGEDVGRKIAAEARCAALAARVLNAPARFAAAGAALSGRPVDEPEESDRLLTARQFGERLAAALDRFAPAGALFWGRAYRAVLSALYEDAPGGYDAQLATLREMVTPTSGRDPSAGLATAIRIADAIGGGAALGPRPSGIGRSAPASGPRARRWTESGEPRAGERLAGERLDAEPLDGEPLDGERGPRNGDPRDQEERGGSAVSRLGAAADRMRRSVRALAEAEARGEPTALDEEAATPRSRPSLAGVGVSDGARAADDAAVAERVAAWRAHFETVIRGDGGEGSAGLSGDGRDDLDAEALEGLAALADREADQGVEPEALDEIVGADVAWAARQFLNLEFEPRSRFDPDRGGGSEPTPKIVRRGWTVVAQTHVKSDLADPAGFFLFFATKTLSRSFDRAGRPEQIALGLKRFLAAPKTPFTLRGRKIAPYPAWLRDHLYGGWHGRSEASWAELPDVDVAELLDRAMLFLSCVRVARPAPETALWRPVKIEADTASLLEPPRALTTRLETFFKKPGAAHHAYALAFGKIVFRNRLSTAGEIAALAKTIDRVLKSRDA